MEIHASRDDNFDVADHHPRSADREEQLIRQALPLVPFVVSDVASRVPRHVHRDDLVSAALWGLAQAARSWSPDRNVSFEHFARMRMRGALLDELRSRDWLSRSARTTAKRVQATTDELTSSLGRKPSSAEIGASLNLTADEVAKVNKDVHRATVLNYDSVFATVESNDTLASEEPTPSDVMLQRETIGYLRDAVSELPERLRHVVVGYFFENRAMQQIANELGVTESRISQMRAEAVELLREGLLAHLEPDRAGCASATPRAARRRAQYVAQIALASDYLTRLSTDPMEPVFAATA